jgi:uncharacterized protein (DUF362 family)/ferredoxin-like protein FixX
MPQARVAIVRVTDSQGADFDSAVAELVELLGGWEEIISKPIEKPILLKPNILNFINNPERQPAITTDLRLVEAVVKSLREWKQEIAIQIGDSSGQSTVTSEIIEKLGYNELPKKYEQLEVFGFDRNSREVEITAGHKLTKALLSADVMTAHTIINLPKLKTHALTRYTGAIKNLFGCVSGKREKANIHVIGNTARGFSDALIDLYSVFKDKVSLNIMDGYIAMEGWGPSAGDPVDLKILLASTDAVALDAVAIEITKLGRVWTNQLAGERKMGENRLEEIEVVGLPISAVQRPFKTQGKLISYLVGSRIISRIWRYARKVPKHDPTDCIYCDLCINACPVQCMSFDENKKMHIDYSECLSCYTCSEMCPKQCFEHKALYGTQIKAGFYGFILLLITALILLITFI